MFVLFQITFLREEEARMKGFYEKRKHRLGDREKGGKRNRVYRRKTV